jgi:uncharacterized protein (DUF2236 family)
VSPLFADEAVIRQVWAAPELVFGGGRALLMQVAHPQVAAAVAEHSTFRSDPKRRLRHTLEATGAVVFGDDDEARAAVRHMRRAHRPVTGNGYAATDPDLQFWVHATVVDTALLVYERFLRPLSAYDAERYYQDSVRVAETLGVPRSSQPADLGAFRQYIAAMVGSLEVSAQARQLAQAVLRPPTAWTLGPWVVGIRQLTVGLLPDRLRQEFHLSWDRPRQALFAAAEVAARQVLPRVPIELRRLPAAVLVAAA